MITYDLSAHLLRMIDARVVVSLIYYCGKLHIVKWKESQAAILRRNVHLIAGVEGILVCATNCNVIVFQYC